MRYLAFVALALAGCSEEPTPPQVEMPKVTTLQAGQWETTSEVTRLTKRDQGTPRINTPAGTRESVSICVAEADVKKPDPKLFMTPEDECTYNNFYMSGGTFNATMKCSRPGLSGELRVAVFGDYQADSFETTRDVTTHLATDGDVNVVAKVTGRRIGACTAG